MKIILTLISMLFCIAHTFAQTNYYTSTKHLMKIVTPISVM